MIEKRCEDCRWLERYNGKYICGYIAEVYHIAKVVHLESLCKISKYKKKE